MSYKPKHFGAVELVPRDLYLANAYRGDQWFFDTLFDCRLLIMMDKIRDQFGLMTVNDWIHRNAGGGHQYRGFRNLDCPVGAPFSQHRFGRAADMIPFSCQVDRIISVIREDDMTRYGEIGAIELGVSWLHIDVRARADGELKLFYP